MFEKFEAFMNHFFLPLARKVDNQQHLSAIKAGMVAMTPFTILGSFFAILPALPNMLGEKNVVSQFILGNVELFALPVTLSIGLIGLYSSMAISFNLANHYKLYIPGAVTQAVFAFLFLTIQFTEDGNVSLSNLGAKGLFTSMIASIVTVELYQFCKKRNLTIRMPEGVPDFVSKSFELIPVTLIVAGSFILTRFALLSTVGELPPTILTRFLQPLVGSMDNPWSVLALNFCICTIFFFGIHPSVFSPITRPIMVVFIAENIAAYQAGQPLPHFYTAGASSAFFGFTGCGISIGCVIACMLSKSKRYRQIGRVSLFPALFGINEPILFGAPIILNPVMFIPHVFGGAIIGTLPMFMMHWGFLDKPIFDPPYVGVFLEGFLTNGDWRSIIANVLQLILTVALYWPFFKVMEKQELEAEQRVEAEKEIFTASEVDILDELGLDF
ncbi:MULTISPECIES: PTS sugar transporter subunit IIC [unclassified Streptococcus]|uniref:PTS sugar transporter subunit IIC n=1 Tax=unclassified Streptococcus TaxID=2608887 RepID=UPI001071B016|nr:MULTISPECIES: PTS transporter subunit EIIC [unclassified Streptococcus]MBF0786342.1 PTS sugar transporter subunit IIC [Streptococcus sp. 19428wC2_LYSM12]MCQ9212451.1 PTS transporter subunit EIIC [Streptococcus sp. B01]MCQ9213789.1 PTS transporter subunit EIIC [Streptococcus sp. O1]TFV06752.1 PTS sugar transporter subunit IIC [Streptococcus sp. LYSM12]